MLFPDNNKRQYCCFVCAKLFKEHKEFQEHVIKEHEEGREYLVCPVPYCKCVVRDLRLHYKNKHKCYPLPTCQLRATVFYDNKTPGKRKKVPNFKEGFHESKKCGKKMHYRSNYELEVYQCLEQMGNVLKYDVEPFSIPYCFRGKNKRYFPDLIVEFCDGTACVWEIKPKNQKGMEQNQAKWAAAKYFCELRGWNFEVLTEEDINRLKTINN